MADNVGHGTSDDVGKHVGLCGAVLRHLKTANYTLELNAIKTERCKLHLYLYYLVARAITPLRWACTAKHVYFASIIFL